MLSAENSGNPNPNHNHLMLFLQCASKFTDKFIFDSFGPPPHTKGTTDRKGVRATVVIVTAGHCTDGSSHALASCYSCCVHSLPGLC